MGGIKCCDGTTAVRAPETERDRSGGGSPCAPCCSPGALRHRAVQPPSPSRVWGCCSMRGPQPARTLMGIPAASQVGGTLDGTPLSAVAIASAPGYALALENGTGATSLISQSGRQPLAGVRAGAQLVAVSPLGTAAAVYYGDTGKASILTGLPDAPQTLREITLDGAPSAMAVSDDGATLAAAISLTANE